MLRHKPDRRKTAELNGYTARRLNEMALSLSSLARSCADGAGRGRGLSREDGLTAVKTAADLVCGSCSRCTIYRDSTEENSYFLYYLLRAFEQKGRVEREDMPQKFLEACGQSQEYIYQLNKSLGRATMNLAWKNRFLESRDTVIAQFRELAVILEEFAHQMEAASDVTPAGERALKRAFRQKKLELSRLLILEYENGQREVFANIRAAGGRCMTAKDACRLVGQALGGVWMPSREGRNVITRAEAPYRFVEEGKYRLVYGVAGIPRDGETVSGDSYTFNGSLPGQVVVSLSDGMGSGETASRESSRVVELTEELLETGFSARAALKMVNTVLLLAGGEQHPATLDLACLDLYTGVLEMMKMGAAPTFVRGENGVEILEAGELPAGVIGGVEPVLLSKKLWEENWIVMVSDGILDALPGEEKELTLREFLEGARWEQPQELAEEILAFASSFEERPRDDMTVLAARIWKRK